MRIFEWPVRVYIEDTDAGGIVFYVNYLKYMERARTELLRSLGYPKAALLNNDLMLVVRKVNAHYHQSALFDDELLITAAIGRIGKASVIMEQTVYRDSELIASAEVDIACVDKSSRKPQRLPNDLLVALNAFCGN